MWLLDFVAVFIVLITVGGVLLNENKITIYPIIWGIVMMASFFLTLYLNKTFIIIPIFSFVVYCLVWCFEKMKITKEGYGNTFMVTSGMILVILLFETGGKM